MPIPTHREVASGGLGGNPDFLLGVEDSQTRVILLAIIAAKDPQLLVVECGCVVLNLWCLLDYVLRRGGQQGNPSLSMQIGLVISKAHRANHLIVLGCRGGGCGLCCVFGGCCELGSCGLRYVLPAELGKSCIWLVIPLVGIDFAAHAARNGRTG